MRERLKVPRRESEVIAAATRIFYEHGYAEASIQMVADRLGFSKGSLYHYVSGKEALLYRVIAQVHDDVDAIITAVLIPEELSSLGRLAYYVRCQMAYTQQHPERLAVYHHELANLGDQAMEEVYAHRREHNRLVSGLIGEAQRDGAVDPALDPRLSADCVFATLVSTHRWFRQGQRHDGTDAVEQWTAFVMRGIAGELSDDVASEVQQYASRALAGQWASG